jgi:hypothetical protein
VPRDAREGSHYAGVVATEDAARKPSQRRVARGTSTFSVTSVVRIAVPMTIALPGRRTRALALDGLKLPVDASGAALSVALRNTGTVLIRRAAVDLRVRRDGRTLFRHQAGLSEILPESPLVYRIPWKGTPMQGTYRVVGTIRPAGAETLHVDAPVTFTEHTARELERKAEEVVLPESSVPPLVWLALAAAVALLAGMAVMLLRTRRRVPA